MPLTQEEIQDLKDQLRQQISHLPPAQRQQAEQQINNLSAEALEAMLAQERNRHSQTDKQQKTIFRSLVDGDIPAIPVEDTKEARAFMDIAPISKGHVIIIPRIPVKDAKQLPLKAFTLAKRIAQRISKKYKARETAIQTENKFGETVIHVIPSYDDAAKDLASQRTKATKEDLEDIAQQLRQKKRKARTKKSIQVMQQPAIQQKSSPLVRKRRIP